MKLPILIVFSNFVLNNFMYKDKDKNAKTNNWQFWSSHYISISPCINF